MSFQLGLTGYAIARSTTFVGALMENQEKHMEKGIKNTGMIRGTALGSFPTGDLWLAGAWRDGRKVTHGADGFGRNGKEGKSYDERNRRCRD